MLGRRDAKRTVNRRPAVGETELNVPVRRDAVIRYPTDHIVDQGVMRLLDGDANVVTRGVGEGDGVSVKPVLQGRPCRLAVRGGFAARSIGR